MIRSRVGMPDRAMPLCILTSEYTQCAAAATVLATAVTFGDFAMPDAVLLDIQDEIALITLNRPDRLNALDYDLIDRLVAALDRIEIEAGVRAVILTGAGEGGVSAGGGMRH